MSVRFDTGTDTLRGACPALSTAAFSWGFSFRAVSAAANGQVATVCGDFTASTGNFMSLEAGGSGLVLFTQTGNSGTAWAFTANTYYYIVVSRSGNRVQFRVFSSSSTPDFTSGDADGLATNYSVANRGYGAASGFNGNSIDYEIESEKWELGVEWSNAECWAEAQKYTLQRSGGTAEITCYLTDINADSEGINDVSGTAQNLTNSGAVTGTNHPSYLETLGGGGGGAVVSPYFFLRSRASAA